MPEPRKPRQPRTHRHSMVRRVLAGFIALLLVLATGTALFAWKVVNRPTIDALPTREHPVDVLMVLGPLDGWRLPMAEQMMREGIARNLVLSTPNMPWDAEYCARKHPWKAYCFAPQPSTTRGEAMGLRTLAEAHGWASVLVLTIDFHVDRARFVFERCLRHPVAVYGPRLKGPDSQLRYQMGYQVVGFAKEFLLGPC